MAKKKIKKKNGTGFRKEMLRSIMAERDITNLALAKKLGVDDNTISNWKRGVSAPRWDALANLAKALGVDYKIFFK